MMADYTELIKSLRCQRIGCGDCPMQDMVMVKADHTHQVWEQYCHAHEAADAIEELSRIVREYQKFDGFLAAHGMFKQDPMVSLPKPSKDE